MHSLNRLFDRLRDAAREHAGAPLTVGDVYQHLIPYRSMRSELGIWELAHYEHLLLRLLSGEGDFLELADSRAREDIERELRSNNPILGIYRDFADVPIRFVGVEEDVSLPVIEPSLRGDVVVEPAPSEASRPGAVAASAPAAQDGPEPQAPAGVAVPAPRGCHTCAEELPEVPGLRFCPSCGSDQVEVPCQACGTRLKEEWNFCVRCGQRRSDRPVGARA